MARDMLMIISDTSDLFDTANEEAQKMDASRGKSRGQ